MFSYLYLTRVGVVQLKRFSFKTYFLKLLQENKDILIPDFLF